MTATANTSPLTVAIFNLIATIVGGGVLSVPYAFSKCGGALYGILWMLLAAICTDQSCSWLCWCARQETGTVLASYGQVGHAAFGPLFEVFISALLFVFLVFVLIAYMVLVKDIWTPVICTLFLPNTDTRTLTPTQLQERDDYWGPLVLLATILFMAPFLLQKTLHALRFNCYVGFASVSILCLALCYHALVDPITANTTATTNVLFAASFWFQPPNSTQDVITAFPILMLSFLCHFNVNPIQKALRNPTVARVESVIHYSMVGCTLLMTLFGLAGYAYVVNYGASVQGNILLNAEQQQQQQSTDLLLTLGRIGCGITIMLAMAMMILPCRDSLLEVLDTMLEYWHCRSTPPTSNNLPMTEATPLVTTTTTTSTPTAHPILASFTDNVIAHYASTCAIVVVCYISAIKVPGVAIVWSLCGSSMAFSIAFILPAACFLQIVHQRELEQENGKRTLVVASTGSKALAWALLVLSLLAAIVCTTQTIELVVIKN